MQGLCEFLKERSLNAKVSNSDLGAWLNRFPADDMANKKASPALRLIWAKLRKSTFQVNIGKSSHDKVLENFGLD